MKKSIESIVLINVKNQTLRIYQVENSENEFCIASDDGEHFEFNSDEAQLIIEAITELTK